MCHAPPLVQDGGRANGQGEGVYLIFEHINGCGPEQCVVYAAASWRRLMCTQKGKS
jgi:hypothetical protein